MKVVLLCSGGVDSVVLSSAVCKSTSVDIEEVIHLFIDYGQPVVEQERTAAKLQAEKMGQPFVEAKIPLEGVSFGKDGANYIPNRNAVMISYAANIAAARGAGLVVFGATAEDRDDYVDCRWEYVELLSTLTEKGAGVVVRAPYVDYDRSTILILGDQHDVNIDDTWSCHVGENGEQCGECISCRQTTEI